MIQAYTQNRTSHYTGKKRKPVDPETIYKINELHYDNNKRDYQVAAELRISTPVVWRHLAVTRGDWEKMKAKRSA